MTNRSFRLAAPLMAVVALLLVARPAGSAWIDMGTVSQGNVSLLIDTIPAGGSLAVTFNVTNLTPGVSTVGTPDIQFQLALRRPGGPTNITGEIHGNPASANLSGPESIPFTEITWSYIQTPSTAPGGTFPITGSNVAIGTNPIYSLTTAGGGTSFAGGELRFSFTPSRVYLQGSYTGTVTFTASRT